VDQREGCLPSARQDGGCPWSRRPSPSEIRRSRRSVSPGARSKPKCVCWLGLRQVAVDQERPPLHLGERAGQGRGHHRLALPGQGARDQDGLVPLVQRGRHPGAQIEELLAEGSPHLGRPSGPASPPVNRGSRYGRHGDGWRRCVRLRGHGSEHFPQRVDDLAPEEESPDASGIDRAGHRKCNRFVTSHRNLLLREMARDAGEHLEAEQLLRLPQRSAARCPAGRRGRQRGVQTQAGRDARSTVCGRVGQLASAAAPRPEGCGRPHPSWRSPAPAKREPPPGGAKTVVDFVVDVVVPLQGSHLLLQLRDDLDLFLVASQFLANCCSRVVKITACSSSCCN